MCSSSAIASGHSLTSARWSRNTRSASANAEMLLNLPQVTCRPLAAPARPGVAATSWTEHYDPGVTALLPLWHDDPYEERAPLEADCETDVLVIGAGIAGLSCAWHLAERGVDCTVVEARTAASGASGRNGGFLVAGAAPAHQDAVRAVRARGRGRHLPRHARLRAADLRDRGRDRRERALRARRLPARHLGAGASWSTRASSTRRCAPTTCRPSGSTRPTCPRSCAGPAASACSRRPTRRCTRRAGCGRSRARSRSAACASSSAARSPSRSTPRATAASPCAPAAATVHAQRVVVAADGALPQLVPYYAPSVRTKRLHMVATAPIAERVVPCAIGARWGYEYLQQRPDGRIAVGGFSDHDGERRRRLLHDAPRSRRRRSTRASSASCATISASPRR